MKIIVYRGEDGQVSVCHPVPNARLCSIEGAVRPFFEVQREAGLLALAFEEAVEVLSPEWAETEDDFLARIQEKSVPATASDIRIHEDIPNDRTFRNAWRTDLTVDMEKARDIWRDRIRAARAPLLAALDVEYQRADEAGDAAAKADVVARKQALRDATADPAIEVATTPDHLKAVWPAALDR